MMKIIFVKMVKKCAIYMCSIYTFVIYAFVIYTFVATNLNALRSFSAKI